MANTRQSSAAPFLVPRPTLHSDVEEISSTQADPNSRNRQICWSDAMDGYMITALLHQVLSSHKRSDNGFSSFHVSKAIERVHNGYRVMVSDKNVRAQLKTLKKEYVEIRQLLSMSGFGLDSHTGRVIADVLAWEELLKGKPEFGKWRTKLCSHYDDLEAIFGNDSATGDRAVTGNDILSPDHDETVHEVDGQNEDTDPSPICTPKRNAEGGTNKVRRRRTQPNDESLVALSSIAESSKKIAIAMESQATLDMLNHTN
ncbi:uncharacterized protein LOC111398052 [Olea europaea var. sylvestris]|uniref:uncharacterized protein LOC111398052 n=1 Tax=Olea europaea var. sylvestris TaxID=158386 RepID=UPI000C1CD240|nr:uncharacterized protein LOC111398052 [Olea europaea var. sylvestris]